MKLKYFYFEQNQNSDPPQAYRVVMKLKPTAYFYSPPGYRFLIKTEEGKVIGGGGRYPTLKEAKQAAKEVRASIISTWKGQIEE